MLHPWLAPTLLATLVAGLGVVPVPAWAASGCTQLNPCRLQGTLKPRVVIEASGAAGKDGRPYHFNAEWGTNGGNGKNLRIISNDATTLRGIGEFPPPFSNSGAAVLHISTSGGRGGDGGKSEAWANGVGGNAGRGGTLQVVLQGSYQNTSTKPGANAISLYSRGGSAGDGYDSGHKNHALAGNGGTIRVNMDGSGALDVSTSAAGAVGLLLDAGGGRGADGRKLAGGWRARGGDGGNGGKIVLDTGGVFKSTGSASVGIRAMSDGGDGGTVFGGLQYRDGAGGSGGRGGEITGSFGPAARTNRLDIEGVGIRLSANGGQGGTIEYKSGFNAPDGGIGGHGGLIAFLVRDTRITTHGARAHGVSAEALGGDGFWGGDSVLGKGGSAGKGGDGGSVDLTLRGTTIITYGNQSYGAAAVADGGGGHNGGAGGVFSRAGNGSQGGRGGSAALVNHSAVTTHGSNAIGLYVSSLGGKAGDGGRGSSIVAVGGNGGRASTGGTARLENNGTVTTHGEGSHALFAQTVGGGGGLVIAQSNQRMIIGADSNAYSPSASGGSLNVLNTGTVTTHGKKATGLTAQSIGGGGGAGGKAAGLIAIGGHGQTGGDAGQVDVTQNGNIATAEEDAVGVLAQSVGGGGGYGGDVFTIGPVVNVGIGGRGGGGQGGSVTGVGLASAATITIGGSGGSADRVTLDGLKGSVRTAGHGADAIKTQSIGGGGGTGGSAVGATLAIPNNKASFAATVQIGGKGGSAGNASRVAVSNDALIATQGRESRGIVAQSLGGGGGKGGSASAHSISIHPKLSFGVSVALGGSGGGGGQGGGIDITHQGEIRTAGHHADGILGQSVGGGGGLGAAGSANTSASGAKSFSLAFALGGSGGDGGNGGTVKLQHEGAIHTLGTLARGIVLQSVGGGGGSSSGADGGADSDTVNSAILLGGSGGKGGYGGAVSLVADASSALQTKGAEAIGMLVQSIGGGGGAAGLTGTAKSDDEDKEKANAKASDKDKKDDDESTSVKAEFALGGKGGSGGQGGRVEVRHAGRLLTQGSQSTAIVAQSIGGGGGAASAARNSADEGDVSLTLAIGGSGGSGGNGGAVQVTQSGVIQTQGDHAHGILAQSVGGGGGLGSVNTAGNSESDISLGGAFGGSGGGQGHGRSVSVVNSGSIATSGQDSYAILAQSVGGGGGGAGGNGGDVTVAHQKGATLLTSGRNAHAVLAQSIGGGGGIGIQSRNTGLIAIQVGGKGGGGGNGGNVKIATEGDIGTQGAGAYGILAQSIGGGGGIGGDGALRIIGPSFKLPASATGRNGKGGDIDIVHNGRIQTAGANAAGILAQSVGGGGGMSQDAIGALGGSKNNSAGGAISIAVGGSVRTEGENSPAIFAQSLGAGGANGNITIAVTDGGNVTSARGTGIFVHGGNANTVTIGQGGAVAALSHDAIRSAPNTRVQVDNQGRVAGSIDLSGSSRNGFVNRGRFDTGATVRLGSSATLANMGVLNPRGAGVIGDSHLLSPLRQHGQTAQGPATLEVDADFRDRRSDTLRYSKSVELGGQVRTLARYPLPNRALTIVDAADDGGELKLAHDLSSQGSLVFQYPLQQPTEKSLAVSVEADFQAGNEALNEDQRNLAGYLQQAWKLESPNELYNAAILFDQFVNVQNVEQYRKALDTLASDAGQGPAAYIPLSNRSFFTRMMSCPQFYQDDTAMREGECAWGRFLGNHTRRDNTSETGGFTVDSQTYQVGGQKELAPGWFLGGSLAYEASRHRVSNLPIRTEGDGFQAGVVLKRQAGPWLFAGSLTAGHGTYKTRRSIMLTDELFEARSRWRAKYVSAGMRASYVHAEPSWYVKPILDMSLTYQRTPSYSESGAGPLNLHFDSAHQWSAMITPSIELGDRYEWRGNTLRPYVSAGVSWLSDTGWDVKASLEGDPEQNRFGLTTDLPRHFGELKAGMVLTRKGGLELTAEYGMRFASNYLSQTGELRLAVHF